MHVHAEYIRVIAVHGPADPQTWPSSSWTEMRCVVKKATELHEICLLSRAKWSVFVCLLPNAWGLQNASYVGRYQNATHVFHHSLCQRSSRGLQWFCGCRSHHKWPSTYAILKCSRSLSWSAYTYAVKNPFEKTHQWLELQYSFFWGLLITSLRRIQQCSISGRCPIWHMGHMCFQRFGSVRHLCSLLHYLLLLVAYMAGSTHHHPSRGLKKADDQWCSFMVTKLHCFCDQWWWWWWWFKLLLYLGRYLVD